MLRLHLIPNQPELLSAANFVQDFCKQASRPSRPKQRSPR